MRSVNRYVLCVLSPRPYGNRGPDQGPPAGSSPSQGRQTSHKPPSAKGDPGWWGHESKQGTELRGLPKTGIQDVFLEEVPFESGLKIKSSPIGKGGREWHSGRGNEIGKGTEVRGNVMC